MVNPAIYSALNPFSSNFFRDAWSFTTLDSAQVMSLLNIDSKGMILLQSPGRMLIGGNSWNSSPLKSKQTEYVQNMCKEIHELKYYEAGRKNCHSRRSQMSLSSELSSANSVGLSRSVYTFGCRVRVVWNNELGKKLGVNNSEIRNYKDSRDWNGVCLGSVAKKRQI